MKSLVFILGIVGIASSLSAHAAQGTYRSIRPSYTAMIAAAKESWSDSKDYLAEHYGALPGSIEMQSQSLEDGDNGAYYCNMKIEVTMTTKDKGDLYCNMVNETECTLPVITAPYADIQCKDRSAAIVINDFTRHGGLHQQ